MVSADGRKEKWKVNLKNLCSKKKTNKDKLLKNNKKKELGAGIHIRENMSLGHTLNVIQLYPLSWELHNFIFFKEE